MTTQKIEPMPLEEVRERLRYGAQSQVSTLEPVDLARMRLTVEALVEEVARLRAATTRTVIGVPFKRCGATDAPPGMGAQRCIFPAEHAGPCLFGDS